MRLRIFVFLFLILSYAHVCNAADNKIENNYLLQATGQYGIGFQDFHWIDNDLCPDPNFNGKNLDDFSPDNKKYCREIVARIYYPISDKNKEKVQYYQPFIRSKQKEFEAISSIPKNQIRQLNNIRSYSSKNSAIIADTKFPVLIFSPGFGGPVEIYENIIGALVSHGYIVVGVNSLFINGSISLPNGHSVNMAPVQKYTETDKKVVPIIRHDVLYTVRKLHTLHFSNPVFSAMDLTKTGVFGHSIGGKGIADITRTNPGWLKAAAALDIGYFGSGEPIDKFDIPFMHIISSNWQSNFSWPLVFKLSNNEYLVKLAKNEDDHDYATHSNFTDFSTLQYLPAFLSYSRYIKRQERKPFDLKLMSHLPNKKDIQRFINPTYILVKIKNNWDLFYYENRKLLYDVTPDLINGLSSSLSNLPKKPPEQLTVADIDPIKKIIFDRQMDASKMFGAGNGWEISRSINTYLIQFFDTYLKNEKNKNFTICSTLSKNTIMKCGPGVF